MARQMLLPNAPWGIGWNLVAGEDTGAALPMEGGAEYADPVSPYADPATMARLRFLSQAGRSGGVGAALGAGVGGASPSWLPGVNPGSTMSRLGAAIQGLHSQLNPMGGGAESFLSGLTGGYGATQAGIAGGYEAQAQRAADDRATAEAEQDRGLRNTYLTAQTNAVNAAAARNAAEAAAPAPPTLRQGADGRWYTIDPVNRTAVPIAGTPARVTGADAPLTAHQIATERRGVRSDRAKQASDLRLHADDVLNSPTYRGLGLGDLTTGADSSAYSDAQGMRQHADWLVTHPLSVRQVDSVRAGTLDYDNYPGAKSPTPQLAPNVRADQLRSQGLDAAAIKAQMAKEGYRIKGVNAQ